MEKDRPKIKVTKDGPYIVEGDLPLTEEIIWYGEEGLPEKWKPGKKLVETSNYHLCRCGKSKDKPYCDGSHTKAHFDGTETTSQKSFAEMAHIHEGPDLNLADEVDLCIGAGFCDRAGGTWNLNAASDDPESKKTAIREACDCPSGRLVAMDKKTSEDIEPKFDPSISLVEYEQLEGSGPIWAKGGVPIESADSKEYEVRNRVTLCRCGKSKNKPFCDGTHVEINFSSKN